MNEHLKLLEHLCFGPENYTNEKAYNKHLRTIAKQWDTTRELAPTINCAHCQFWEPKNKVDTKITKFERKMDRLDDKMDKTVKDFEDKLQKALDNPLAN